jgi:hypothetical protein
MNLNRCSPGEHCVMRSAVAMPGVLQVGFAGASARAMRALPRL